MTAPLSGSADPDFETRWRSPIIAHRFDTTVEVRSEEVRAIQELGVRNLRRFQYHDPSAPGWHVIRRLLRPLEAVNAGLDSPPTPHRRRAMLDSKLLWAGLNLDVDDLHRLNLDSFTPSNWSAGSP